MHPVIGRRVAIKVLGRALSTDPQAVSRFISEARAIVEISSPYIVDIYSFGSLDDGRQYYVMELLDGSSLADYLLEHGPLEPRVALRILDGIAQALSAAHAAGVVHRDLKPDNVFVAFDQGGEPVPKLLDFGVAKLIGKPGLAHHTSTGAMIGTPAYMAPEQALGLEIDHRSDIYAMGIVAFEMLTGRPPFDADSLVELVRKHAEEPAPAVSTIRAKIGSSFDRAVAHMLDKDPALRPATVEACRGDLRRAAVESGVKLSLPDLTSLRPPPLVPSQPESATPTWDGETVPADERATSPLVRAPKGAAADTVGGTAGAAAFAEETAPRRGSRAPIVVAAGALLALGAGVFALSRPATPGDDVPVAAADSSAATSAESTGAPSASTSAPEPAASIELRVETTAKGARVLLRGKDVGAPPGPFAIERGDEPVRIEVRADGYEPEEFTIVPNADQVLRPMWKQPKPRPLRPPPVGKPPATPPPPASVSPEIEPPSYAGE